MRITWKRWVASCALGIAFIAVATIRAGADWDEAPVYRWQLQRHALEDKVSQRQQAVWSHLRAVSAAYRSAQDSVTASRVFGAARANTAGPDVWFAPDVPERSRRAVTDMIAREEATRGEWRGRGPVGVMVVTDTFTAIDHVKLPANYDRDRSLTTAVLPASGAAADRCVTVVRLRHHGLEVPPMIQSDRLPLDGCAFTDAFGRPGADIAARLARERYAHARRFAFEQPTDELKLKRYAWDDGDLAGRSCRAGDDQACLAEVRPQDDRYGMWWWGRDLSVGMPSESPETFSRIDFETDVFLESLARDMGPARFQRMWQSPKPIEQAYFDQTGESFASWVRARLVRFYGTYRAGALPSPSANMITILLVLLLAGISIRLASRPSF